MRNFSTSTHTPPDIWTFARPLATPNGYGLKLLYFWIVSILFLIHLVVAVWVTSDRTWQLKFSPLSLPVYVVSFESKWKKLNKLLFVHRDMHSFITHFLLSESGEKRENTYWIWNFVRSTAEVLLNSWLPLSPGWRQAEQKIFFRSFVSIDG